MPHADSSRNCAGTTVEAAAGVDAGRREWLCRTGVLSGSALFAALTTGTGRRALAAGTAGPRVGMAIGNGGYRDSPLTNPANDARAIAALLTRLGFDMTLLVDATRSGMQSAMHQFADALARKRATGLFYYAGHGVQLAWRNYLIPVDASIDTLDDVPARSVELNHLLGLLAQARNPVNIVILDACRDNPFGNRVPLERKGLSQFDAPPGSLLAYATAPGNAASDGAGDHGLFTECLLREIDIPELRIEDALKRTRVKVRHLSAGKQIPWESSSLEDDFYFVPPARKSASEAAQDVVLESALQAWRLAEQSDDVARLEDYLHNYPGGPFSEIAQARLDRLLASQGEKPVAPAAAQGSPFTKGSARVGSGARPGDRYAYRTLDLFSHAEQRRWEEVVTLVSDDRIVFDGGKRVVDPLGNDFPAPRRPELPPTQIYPAEYALGAKWRTWLGFETQDGLRRRVLLEFKVLAREKIALPAGTFDAFKVQGRGTAFFGGNYLKWDWKYWIDPPACRRPVLIELHTYSRQRNLAADRTELLEFREQGRGV